MAAGLTDADLAHLRALLDGGGRPRVRVAASAGLPDGTTGSVVRIDDPATTAECVVVRVGGDELPFAPGELEVAAGRRRGGSAAPSSVPSADKVTDAAAGRAPTTRKRASGDAPSAPGERAARAKRRARELAVLVAYADGEWSVQVTTGARTLLRRRALRPGTALALVAALEAPEVSAAVAEIVEAGRADAAARAEALRRELADAEALLAEYGNPGVTS